MARQIIQIAAAGLDDGDWELFALCEDNTVWRLLDVKWVPIRAHIPDPTYTEGEEDD